jgi:hypothetical protein
LGITKDPIREEFAATKPPDTHGGGEDPHRVAAPVKKKIIIYYISQFYCQSVFLFPFTA